MVEPIPVPGPLQLVSLARLLGFGSSKTDPLFMERTAATFGEKIGRAAGGKRRQEEPFPEDEESADVPSPIVSDQELSPVFGLPATAGAIFGMTEDARKAAERQIAKLKDALKNSVEAKAGRAVRAKKIGTGAAIGAAKDLAKKAGKLAGKRGKKGPPIRLGPTGAVIIGSQVIRDIAEQVEAYQLGKMDDIIKRQQKETDRAVARVRKAQQQPETQAVLSKKLEPDAPKMSRQVGTVVLSSAGKAPQGLPSSTRGSAPIAAPPKAAPAPSKTVYATPGQMKIPVSQRIPKWVSDLTVLSSIYRAVSRSPVASRAASGFLNPIPMRPGSPERLQSRSSAPFATALQSATGTKTGTETCYTVCRKTGGKKKRKKPRICISPAKAKSLGIFS